MRALWLTASIIAISTGALLEAQPPAAANIYVRETTGIRRNRYPVNARVPLPRGTLRDAGQARLTFGDSEVEAQVAVDSKHADGSIQWLAVDFNSTIGPLEEQTYRLEYGQGVKAQAQARGITLTENAESFDTGRARFNKTAVPLIRSVNYRQEDIGQGANGIAVTDNGGTTYDLTKADSVKTEIVKRGPLYVMLRYSGRLVVDAGNSVPFTITIEMPNSKTWVKYTASVEDPTRRVREISFHTPFAFAGFPWLWDFGTGSWTYGAIRNATDSVVLAQTVKAGGGNTWQIRTGPKGQEQPYEVAGGSRPKIAEGWGHFQDSKEVIGFGFDNFGRGPGTYTITLDGQGQNSYRFAPEQPAARHQITVYQHYVASPTPIGAVTSPPSMLNPLISVCDREQYVKSGVPAPPAARASR